MLLKSRGAVISLHVGNAVKTVLFGVMIFLTAFANAADKEKTPMDFFKGEPDTAYPDVSPLLVNAQARDYQSLNGMWNIIIDEAGMAWRVITNNDYVAGNDVDRIVRSRLVEHSFDERKQLKVPGDWNSQSPELDRYRSRILYQKNVDLKVKEGKRYIMHFGGANYTTDLFVNNRLVGRHIGGYTSFNFDVTEFVKDGSNSIIVRVDAHLDETTIPTMRTSDFWKYGGLIGDVGLVTVPATYISQYQVYLNDLNSREITGWVKLEGEQVAGQQVQLQISKARVEATATTDDDGRAHFTLNPKKLKLWSPDSPYLYDVKLTLDKETVKDRIGFRTIETDGLAIKLNGEPIHMRGISMHEETILHPGISTSREDVKAMFDLVKDLNANFVRLAHYPHNEHTLKLADEMGLMLWSEVPIVSLIDWENEQTLAVAKSQVHENVTRDMNRAAVVMWSIANESFPQTDARLKFLTELAAVAREADASQRPIVSALVGGQAEEFKHVAKFLFVELLKHPKLPDDQRKRLMAMAEKMQAGNDADKSAPTADEELVVNVTDPLGEVVDIAGYNQYFGWYYSKHLAMAFGVDEMLVRDAMLNIMSQVRFENPYGKPMIISEFGASAKYGFRSETAELWSEEYQARVFDAQLKMLPKSEFIQGYSPWVLKDFRSHLRELNDLQDTYNRKGLVSEKGEKKLAYDVLKKHYADIKEKD